jgi:hypothetical protein
MRAGAAACQGRCTSDWLPLQPYLSAPTHHPLPGTPAPLGSPEAPAGNNLSQKQHTAFPAPQPPENTPLPLAPNRPADDVFDAARQRQQAQRARRRRLLGRDVPRLDECGLGPHHRSVLPPVAVRAALRSGGSSQAELDRLPAATAAATASAAGRKSKGLPQNGAAAPAGTAGSPGASAGGAGGGSAAAAAAGSGSGRRKKGGWWRSLYGPKRLQWQDYRIGEAVLCINRPCAPHQVHCKGRLGC